MRRVYLLALGAFAIGTDTFVTAGVLPAIMRDLEISLAQAGQLVTVFALAFAVAAPVLAAALANVPRRRLLLAALVVFVLANVASAVAPSYPALLLTRVLAAVGAAIYTPTAAASAAALVPAEQRGRALAIVLGGTTVATVLGVPVAAYLGLETAWRWTFLLVAGVALVGLVALAVMLPAVPGPPAVGLRDRLRVLADRQVLPAILTTVLYFLGGFVVYTYLAPALTRGTQVGEAGIAAFLLVFGVAGVVGNWLGGRLTDGLGPLPVLVGAMVVFAVALLLFPLLSRSIVGAGAGLAVWGISAWALTVPQQHRLLSLAPRAPTVAVGLNSSAVFLGIGLSGLVGGAALRLLGVGDLGYLGGAVVLLALLVVGGQTLLQRRSAVRDGSAGRLVRAGTGGDG